MSGVTQGLLLGPLLELGLGLRLITLPTLAHIHRQTILPTLDSIHRQTTPALTTYLKVSSL